MSEQSLVTSQHGIPLPSVTQTTAPYWQACRNGVLSAQRCRDCQQATFPPEEFCTYCLSPHLDWEQSAGLGTVRGFSIVERPAHPSFSVPYVAAIVELKERWLLYTNLINCRPADVHAGLPVRVVFVPMSDMITLPYFESADSDGSATSTGSGQ